MDDTQCGFKAISRDCAQQLLPMVKDTGWFWDTELLLMARKGGWKIAFVPVRWLEDRREHIRRLLHIFGIAGTAVFFLLIGRDYLVHGTQPVFFWLAAMRCGGLALVRAKGQGVGRVGGARAR